MKTVQQILNSKGYDIWRIQPSASVFEAISLMAEKEVGALVVMEGDRLVGIISERDYARKIILDGRSSHETATRDIMTTYVICVHPGQTIDECMTVMTEKRIRHLPVLERERLIGIISIGDLVKAKIEEQQFMIEQLEHYITG